MTQGQIQRLQDLSKCSNLPYLMNEWVTIKLLLDAAGVAPMDEWDKLWLRRLTHLYRNQIRAIKRNQKVTA